MNYYNLVKHLKVKNEEIKDYILNIKEPNFINKFWKKEMYFELIKILQFLEIKHLNHNEIVITDQYKDDFFIIPLKGSLDILEKKRSVADNSTNILKTDEIILKELKDSVGNYAFNRFYNFKNIYDKKKFNLKYKYLKTIKEGKSFGNMLKYEKKENNFDEVKYIIVSNNLNYQKSVTFKEKPNWINIKLFNKFDDKVIIGIISKNHFNKFENNLEKYEYTRKIKFIKNIFPKSYIYKLDILLKNWKTYKFKKNEIIIKSKSKIDFIYFIKNGKILLKDNINIKKKTNINVKVRLLSKNNTLGINEILKNHNKYFFNGICYSDKCSLYGIKLDNFIQFIQNYPCFIKMLKENVIDFKNYLKNKKNIIEKRSSSIKKSTINKIDLSNIKVNNDFKILSERLDLVIKKKKIKLNEPLIHNDIKINSANRFNLINKAKNCKYNGKLKLGNKKFFKIKYFKVKKSTPFTQFNSKNNFITRNTLDNFKIKTDKSKSISIFNKFLKFK